MTFRVLLSAPYMIPVFDRFAVYFQQAGIEVERARVEERLSEEQLLSYAGQVDGVICGDDRFSARVLKAYAPRLKVISKWGTGIDSIDTDSAKQLGIEVCNTPGAFSEPVADSVLGYMLAFARQIPFLDRAMKAGAWDKIPGRALAECTLGVVGVGNVGTAVLRRAGPFGLRLLGNDIRPIPPDTVNELGVQMCQLERLLSESDFVSLNCDLNPTSYHLLNTARLKLIKHGAVLINTARGPVVDEPALIEALQNGRLAGAGLDVFEDEPLPASSPLRSMDQVLLAPHNANSSYAAWERVHWNTIRNLFRALGVDMPSSGGI